MYRPLRRIAPLLALLFMAASPGEFPDASRLPSRPELPDPLVRLDGQRVTTAEGWTKSRRGELKSLFEHYMYGKAPHPGSLWSIERTDPNSLGGKATTKEVAIGVGPDGGLKIHLLLVVPNRRTGPAPVFLGTNFYGNHTATKDPAVRLSTAWMPDKAPGCKDNRATEAARGLDADVWDIETSIERGYAVATFYCGDVAPDHPGLTDGVFTLTRIRSTGSAATTDTGVVASPLRNEGWSGCCTVSQR